jgi:hypothetical protein
MTLRLLLLALVTFSSHAQNSTQIEPLECYQARADQSNLAFASAYSTIVYALTRALQPSLAIFNRAMKEKRESKETGQIVAGGLEGFHSLEGTGSVLLNGLQVMSTLSLLAPMYWYPYSMLSDAECDHAKSMRSEPNSTKPLECYKADAYDNTAVFEISYAWGLYVGVYMVLPFLLKSIVRWTKGCCADEETAGTEAPKVVADEPAQANTGIDALGGGLNVASMSADKYSLVDVQAWTMIIAYITPMIFWGMRYPAREKCDFALANRTNMAN